MRPQAVWVPGRFSLTNKMLDNLRAAGVYAGRSRSGRPRGSDWDHFATETAAIRLAVKQRVRSFQTIAPQHMCVVNVDVLGHGKHDPDAWYLLAKAAVDGLCDAGVILSDRRQIWSVLGRVMQRPDEDTMVRAMAWSQMAINIPEGESGFLLALNCRGLTREGVVREVLRYSREGHA